MFPDRSHDLLFSALQDAGIPRSYVRRMLPDWWSDELIQDPNARVELDINLSRMFGLKLSNLLQDRPTITIDLPGGAKYKRSRRIGEGELGQATAIVHSLAKMIASAMTNEVLPIPENALDVRDEILGMGPKRVSLMAVIQYLWSKGIPTIHVTDLPVGLKKMDGLALKIDGRPVIVLCKRSTFEAWHLFIVAHELAHYALGHIEADEVLVDCTLGEESYFMGEDDQEEVAADRFAGIALNGGPIQYTSTRPANAAQLVDAALRQQEETLVDAGHVILNYGHRNAAWPIAQTALKRLDKGDAPAKINQFLFDHLELRLIPEASSEFLLKIAGFSLGEGPRGSAE